MKNLYLKLGASMYVPATNKDIVKIAKREKISNLKSVIFCLEDAIFEHEVDNGVQNIQKMLYELDDKSNHNGLLKFIRVRNPEVFEQVLKLENINIIDGFVLPKFTMSNQNVYQEIAEKHYTNNNLSNSPSAITTFTQEFALMPTLETKEVFDIQEMTRMARFLSINSFYNSTIICMRIGGNDLMNILGLRRSRTRSLYETPIGNVISNLVTIFKPYGFNLTAPVCEVIDNKDLLLNEVPIDLEYGLFGKTAIHPEQIDVIEQFYRPSKQDVEMANDILSSDTPAVFKKYGIMCEKTVHSDWAKNVLIRKELF